MRKGQWCICTPCLKKQSKLFSTELRQISTNCVRCTHFPPHLIYVHALPRKTQMFQIVTQRCDY